MVRRGNAGKKSSNKGADCQPGPIKSGFFAVNETKNNKRSSLLEYIHAVKYICQGTNAEFVIYIIFILPFFFDQLVYDDRKT